MNWFPLILILVLGTNCQNIKINSAAYFKKHDGVHAYEVTAKVLLEVKLPYVHSDPPARCEDDDLGCWAEVQTHVKKQELMEYVSGLRPNEFRPRRKRQAVLLIAAAGAVGGYLLHSAFSGLGNKLFGSDTEANHHVNQIWDAMRTQRQEFLLFRDEVDLYSTNLSSLVGRNWWFNTILEKQGRQVFFLNQVTDFVTKVQLGMNQCSSNLIPSQFLNSTVLSQRLSQLENGTLPFGYHLSVPVSQIGEYHKLKIADCFMSNTTIYVLLNIPMTKNVWNIHELIPLPFAYNNQTCSLDSPLTEIVAVSVDKVLVLDPMHYKFCDLIKEKICYVPLFPRPSKISSNCASGLFHSTSLERLGNSCNFKCTSQIEPITFSVDFHTLITVHTKKITRVCGNTTTDFLPEAIGSVELIIKCGCKYVLDGKTLDTKSSCIDTTMYHNDIQLAIPHFILPSSNSSLRFSLGLNQNWTKIVPVLNISKELDRKISAGSSFFYDNNDYHGIWLICISSVVAAMTVVICLGVIAVRRNLNN